MPRKDPIVEEVHAAREAIARESGYDLDWIIEGARARQAASGRPVVRLPPVGGRGEAAQQREGVHAVTRQVDAGGMYVDAGTDVA